MICTAPPPLNSSPINHSHTDSCSIKPQHISIIVLLCLLFLGGFLLNSFSLWVFCCRTSKWTSGNVLQFHLALSDAIVMPVAPLLTGYFFSSRGWTFGMFLCQLKVALLSVHFYGSITFLTLISIHRYVVVVHYKRTSAMTRVDFVHKLCGGVWLVLLVCGASCFAIFGISKEGNHTLCLSIHQGEYINTYFMVNFILLVPGFLLPFLVALVCYTQLARSVSQLNINTAKGQLIKTKSRNMVAICLMIFGFCFMPLNVVRTVAVLVKQFSPNDCQLLLRLETAYYTCWVLAGANCCLDPVLYCFGSQNFNKVIRRSLRHIRIKTQEVPKENELDSQNLTTQAMASTGSLAQV